MVEWIRANKPAKLEGLWKAVLPEGGTAPPAEFAADLFWLLHQGHILLFTDDTLVVQEVREAAPAPEGEAKAAKKKKRKAKKPRPAGETEQDAETAADESPDEDADEVSDINPPEPHVEAPVCEAPVVEAPVVEAPVVSAPKVETDFSEAVEKSPPNPEAGVDDPAAL